MSTFRLGVDVGGTFTDAFLVDTESGALRRQKVLTTPEDQSEGTLAVIAALDVSAADIELFTHGSTVGINALLQRKGASAGLLCTEGTRDLLDMGRLRRPYGDNLYDPTWMRPHLANPIVHRRHIREIPERLLSDGSVYVGLDEDAVRREVQFLRDEGVDSIAVCLLHAYANPAHEERVIEIIRDIHPDAYVQSSRVRPVFGEYGRTMAAVIDASTGPLIANYLRRVKRKLADVGYRHSVRVMQMNGGVRTLDHTIKVFPAYALQSGPTAGVLGAEYYARKFTSTGNLVCVDIGGTSTDIGIVSEGKAHLTDDWEFDFNMPLGAPAIDVRSLGAGGGSLIQVDEMGTISVGPDSAGAQPGPAAYGRGGTQPTTTDAYVAMGIVQPSLFLGGQMPLDREAALRALGTVADAIGLDPLELADGAIKLMNVNIEAELTKMAFEQALDLRDFSLLAYGGAGAVHASQLARVAGLQEALVPYFPGGFSALGMVTAPPKVEHATSVLLPIDSMQPERLEELFTGLDQEVLDDLADQGISGEHVQLTRSAYGMYEAQSFDNRLDFPSGVVSNEAIAQWKSSFHDLYDRLYGYAAPEMGIIVTTLSVSGGGESFDIELPPVGVGGAEPSADATSLRSRLYLEGVWHEDVPFYDRTKLAANNRLPGPAVVDDGLSTALIDAESVGEIDAFGNIHITVESEETRA